VLRCAICARRLGQTLTYVEETGDVPEPRQSWLLCAACNAAVHEQMAQSPIRSPLRLRVAVGLVAAERTPEARRARYGQLSDQAWERFIFWSFVLAFLAHFAVMVAVAALVAHH
jgi:hypothetical protein